MSAKLSREEWQQRKVSGWTNPLARWVTGLTLFLTLTGLVVYLAPFSLFNQHAVLVHTVLGLAFVLPFFVYMARHIIAYWDYPLTHSKFTGWVSGGMALVCLVSGLVLTWQALFSNRIGDSWQLVHIVTTFGLLIFLVPHLISVLVVERKRKQEPSAAALLAGARSHGLKAMAITLGGLLITGGLCFAVRPVAFDNSFPDDYDMGTTSPFAPSLALSDSGDALDPRSLSGSASCGSSGCHPQIYKEWQPSAHRYASMDAAFQAIQGVMAEQNGPVTTRYCGGCHDPISLFSGTKNIGAENLTELSGYNEGISCLACHAISETDVKGNANYVMTQPERYAFELKDDTTSQFVSDFMIRAYPQQHIDSLSRRMFKTPEFCAACHKQFIDEEVNRVGWVQLQNQFDNWRASRWNHEGDVTKTIECRECHMPLIESTDPAAGDVADFNRTDDDGKHRSHRFLGANQFIPALHELEGAEEHVALIDAWLQGEYDIPEIADRWNDGPAVPIELDVPGEVMAGNTVAVRVNITNNKVGHDFPTGPLDIIQAWISIDVTNEDGEVVYHTGSRDDHGTIEEGTFMFKAEPVDRYGNLIDRHNLWEMVGVRFKRSLFPGAAEVASFDFPCPGMTDESMKDLPQTERLTLTVPSDATGELTVKAQLNYRKIDQYMLDFAFGDDSGLTAAVTVMSTDEAVINVLPPAPEGTR